jgi:hypothetical protein
VTLTTDAVFTPQCTTRPDDILLTGAASNSKYTDFRDPFYASTLPQCYALAATTVIAYMLVIMLLITPRTFLHQGAVVLGRRGFTNGPSGSDAGIGIGGRPWLQKVAALTVAISLSIATADTFKVAEIQYNMGIMDATTLQKEVEDGQELKIIRVISDTFLWLAQAQTLIRLFPRQREKIIIKWTAFALIVLDVLFSILNNWVYEGNSRPQSFVDAVPALTYLFQLTLSLLYCAWVIYYSLTKKKFAYYHPQMRNICLVALLSLVSVMIPVVFFVLDVSKPTLAAWGDYVRWVGAAAASVVVWEWVERIEALERNDKKDGVLGREVFDGDEMLDVTPSSDYVYGKGGKNDYDKKGGGGSSTGSHGISWPAVAGFASRYRHRHSRDMETGTRRPTVAARFAAKAGAKGAALWPMRPPPAATPASRISRTDTASAQSTVYAVRYHPIGEAASLNSSSMPLIARNDSLNIVPAGEENAEHDIDKTAVNESREEVENMPNDSQQHKPWHVLSKANPFRRMVHEPPPEVSAYTVKPVATVNGQGTSHGWDFRSRIEDFAANQADKFREKAKPPPATEALPVTVIPAPPRRRNLAATLEELEQSESHVLSVTSTRSSVLPIAPLHSHPTSSNQLSDSYTHSDLNHRPSIPEVTSFTTNTPLSSARHSADPISPVSPFENDHDRDLAISPSSPQSSQGPQGVPTAANNGLPLLRIPAPPRRPKVPQE